MSCMFRSRRRVTGSRTCADMGADPGSQIGAGCGGIDWNNWRWDMPISIGVGTYSTRDFSGSVNRMLPIFAMIQTYPDSSLSIGEV